MRSSNRLLALLALAALLPATSAAAQLDDVSYGGADYESRRAALLERNDELQAEVARYHEMLDAGAAGGGSCCNPCCLTPAAWFDPCCCGPTWSASVAGDGWRDASDEPNNFGNRFGIDATWALNDCGMRGHLGMAYGLYDYHGHTSRFDGSSAEQQIFLTAGVYRRASGCGGDDWTWAASWDFLNDNHYGFARESIDLHQVRFLVGRMMNPCNEFGVWGAFGVVDDDYNRFTSPLATIEVQDQVNLYWRRYWDFGGETMLYGGVAQNNITFEPGFFSGPFELPGDDLTEFVVGLRGIAPLSCNVGLFGGAHYVIPSASGGRNVPFFPAYAEENWSVTFGVMWVRGCSLPLLPTADNGWMGKRLPIGISTT